jgi:hypothetical protein
MFITESESGCILRAEMPEPGRPMYSHQVLSHGGRQTGAFNGEI